MPILYEDTAPGAAPGTALDHDLRVDVVVVGGGFTGLSAALHLAERGVRVVVLEAHTTGWGASGCNGGQVNPGLKHDPDRVEADFGDDLGSRMNALAAAAPDRVFDIIRRHHIACEARRNGTLRAAIRGRPALRVEASVAQWQNRHAPVRLLVGDALAQATGTTRYRAAMLDMRGGDLNPLSYARGLARAGAGAGAVIHEDSRALAMEAQGDQWRVTTAAGSVCAPHVIIATNGYTGDLWPGVERSIVPVFGAIAATGPLPDAVAREILPSRCVVYESGAITVYYRVDSRQRLIIGGRGPMREITSPADVPHITAYAEKLWPRLRGIAWTHGWGGRLAMTADQYPHVHEPARGVHIALGYNGRGVAMATTVGALLARRIVSPGEEFDLPITAIAPLPLHPLWPLAVRAAILRGRVLDSLGF